MRSAAIVLSVGLVAVACSDRKSEDGAVSGGATTVAESDGTDAGTDTTTGDTATDGTEAEGGADTTEPTETTEPAREPVLGGTLIMSGESEVTNPWTPAAMQCDPYCYQRIRTIYDSLATFGADDEIHPFLAETITPNEDFTEWTIKVREGITFHDGTPLDADAVIYNLQTTGTSLLVSAALTDVAKVPSAADPSTNELKIEKVDDFTLTIFTGKGGDPNQPVSWPGLPAYFTQQWGLIASPTWLEAVAADPSLASQPVGTGPFIFESYAPRDRLVVNRNPDYWMTDANGQQLPYLDRAEFRVIEDSETGGQALESGEIDMLITSTARVIADFQELGDEFNIVEQDELGDTSFLLPDLSKGNELADRRVRCALSLAIDRVELIDSISAGLLEPANGPFSPGQQGYLEDNGLVIEQDLDAARALIEEYEAETGQQVTVNLGHTPIRVNDETSELLIGWWNEIGVETTDQSVPQDAFISEALFGTPVFELFIWRQHAGVDVDQQYFWWHSAGSKPDGELSLNFARLNDPGIDAALDTARSATSEEEATAAAEEINRIFGENCYFIPLSWALWGVISEPTIFGIGDLVLPDGEPARDGAGLAGNIWLQTVFIEG